MDFALSEEQIGLVESTGALLAAKCSTDRIRELIDGDSGFDAELWRRGSEIGWPGLAIAEDVGGSGQQAVDLALVAVELGAALAAVPFIPTVTVADAISRGEADSAPELLSSMAAGPLIATWAFAEYGQPWSVAGIGTRARRGRAGYVLDGTKVSVPDADTAQLLLVDATLDEGLARFLVPRDAPGIRIRRQRTLDVARDFYGVTFDEVSLDPTALLDSGDAAAQSIDRSMQLITLLTCAELVGIGRRLLTMTVDYVKDRHQFGRPVGSFQAVKHKCSDMRIWLQASTAATFHAAMAFDGDHAGTNRSVSSAKAYVSDAINRVAGHALQLHGGIGFTWEHDLHLYLRRARADSMLYGDAPHHRERLCRSLLAEVPQTA